MERVLSGDNELRPELRAKENVQIVIDPPLRSVNGVSVVGSMMQVSIYQYFLLANST